MESIAAVLLDFNRRSLYPSHAINLTHNIKALQCQRVLPQKRGRIYFLKPAKELSIHSITAYSQSYWHANFPLMGINHLFSLSNCEPTLLELTLSVPTLMT